MTSDDHDQRGQTGQTGRTVAGHEHRDDEDVERAEELAEETAEQNSDEVTTREAIEQELASKGLSEEGEWIGQHNE